jgi:hypothetical protein
MFEHSKAGHGYPSGLPISGILDASIDLRALKVAREGIPVLASVL